VLNGSANFVPPAYDLANLVPSKINFKIGGMITSLIAFPIGALWVSVISQLGMFGFVNTLGSVLAPMYGIMIADYYLIKKQKLMYKTCSPLTLAANTIIQAAGIGKH
jgi:NCS1 family nucleobase:cation symporter-1